MDDEEQEGAGTCSSRAWASCRRRPTRCWCRAARKCIICCITPTCRCPCGAADCPFQPACLSLSRLRLAHSTWPSINVSESQFVKNTSLFGIIAMLVQAHALRVVRVVLGK